MRFMFLLIIVVHRLKKPINYPYFMFEYIILDKYVCTIHDQSIFLLFEFLRRIMNGMYENGKVDRYHCHLNLSVCIIYSLPLLLVSVRIFFAIVPLI